MIRKILFLDIDGVIAVEASNYQLSEHKQKLLGEIIKQTNCEIVISSSWRKQTVLETQMYFEQKGFDYVHRIVGITIRAYHHLNNSKIHLSIPRGVEIKQWLDTNIHSNNGKDFKKLKSGKDFTYCILDDDDSDMLLEHKNNFIKTDTTMVLSINELNKVINILNNNLV